MHDELEVLKIVSERLEAPRLPFMLTMPTVSTRLSPPKGYSI